MPTLQIATFAAVVAVLVLILAFAFDPEWLGELIARAVNAFENEREDNV